MNVRPIDELPELLVLDPPVYRDDRGTFRELFRRERYAAVGITAAFVQDNLSISAKHVLRGLHLQHPHGQGKLVSVLAGAVFDVAVDVRRGSPTFGRWAGVRLDAERGQQLYVPPGFAHGFLVLEDGTYFHYKCTAPYVADAELVVRWDDPAIGIDWPLSAAPPLLSPKDAAAPLLSAVPLESLPPAGA